MKRKLFGIEIRQKSKSEFFSATDIIVAGNMWRNKHRLANFSLQSWLKNKSTQEFIIELEEKYGKAIKKVKYNRAIEIWVHPLLFIDLALSISPKLKIETYEWLFDCLIKNRNDSGNSYKKMCGCLFAKQTNNVGFHKFIADVAIKIQDTCNVTNWQKATEEQLNKMDKIQEDIAWLADVMNNNNEAVRMALTRYK